MIRCHSVLYHEQSELSHVHFDDGFAADLRRVDAWLLLLIEIERQKIAFRFVHTVQIVAQLIDAAVVVNLSAPDFQFDDELLASVVDHYVHAAFIPRLRFHIIMARAVDDWHQENQKALACIRFCDRIATVAEQIRVMDDKTLHHRVHVQPSVADICAFLQ